MDGEQSLEGGSLLRYLNKPQAKTLALSLFAPDYLIVRSSFCNPTKLLYEPGFTCKKQGSLRHKPNSCRRVLTINQGDAMRLAPKHLYALVACRQTGLRCALSITYA